MYNHNELHLAIFQVNIHVLLEGPYHSCIISDVLGIVEIILAHITFQEKISLYDCCHLIPFFWPLDIMKWCL